jgi:RNA polymerase sigma factor (TIGR02999 family)
VDHPHFLRLAARAMRQVLIDHGRTRNAKKRNNGLAVVDAEPDTPLPVEDYLTLNTALEKLEAFDPQLGDIIELRFFGGLSVPETAEALNISEATVKREWAVARAWLRAEFGLSEANE